MDSEHEMVVLCCSSSMPSTIHPAMHFSMYVLSTDCLALPMVPAFRHDSQLMHAYSAVHAQGKAIYLLDADHGNKGRKGEKNGRTGKWLVTMCGDKEKLYINADKV